MTKTKADERDVRQPGPKIKRPAIPAAFQISRPVSVMSSILREAEGAPATGPEATGSNIDRVKIDRPEIDRPISTRPKISRADSTRLRSNRPNTDPAEAAALSPERGFLAIPHDVLDKVMPTLQPSEQVVLLYLYRLSRGFGNDSCEVGQGKIGTRCNMTRNTVKNALRSLEDRGWIERIETGSGHECSVFKVNLPAARSNSDRVKTDRLNSDRAGFARSESERQGVNKATGSHSDRANPGPIKNMNPELNTIKETPTQMSGVGGGSRFSLEECRRYADHLKATGQGINNPGGYATKIFRSGEADGLVEAFLASPGVVDVSRCADCGGCGMRYIDRTNPDLGVEKCRHERLAMA
jgi:hypothetical protein